MTRVVHLMETLGSGGAERLLHTNLKHLDRERFRSSVVTVYPEPSHWAEPIRALGVEVTTLGCRGRRDLPGATMLLYGRLRKFGPELLHTHLWDANLIGRVAGRLAGIPVISSVHNPDHEPEAWSDGAEVSLRKRRLAQTLDRWTAAFGCRRMIAVSDYVRGCAHRRLGYPLEKIDLLYNPIDLEEIQAASGAGRAEVRRALGLPEQCLLLLMVGRLSPQKGHLFALQALPAILARHPSAYLVAAGGKNDAVWVQRLEEETRRLGLEERVRFLGPRRDVPDLLRACDLFLFPSLYEGLGIALVEAMAAGAACIASETGPIPEVVRHSADGWLIPPGDANALAEAVSILLAEPARRAGLGQAAIEATRVRFAPETAARRLEEIYASVLGKRATAPQAAPVVQAERAGTPR